MFAGPLQMWCACLRLFFRMGHVRPDGTPAVPPSTKNRISTMQTLINGWYGKLETSDLALLKVPALWTHDVSNSSDDVFLVLSDGYLSPKVQLFVKCFVGLDASCKDKFKFRTPPFRLTMMTGNCRMSTQHKALCTVSSEEILLQIASRCPGRELTCLGARGLGPSRRAGGPGKR